MNKRQKKKKQRNVNKWWEDFEGIVYGYRNNRVMNRAYHEHCVQQARNNLNNCEIKMKRRDYDT